LVIRYTPSSHHSGLRWEQVKLEGEMRKSIALGRKIREQEKEMTELFKVDQWQFLSLAHVFLRCQVDENGWLLGLGIAWMQTMEKWETTAGEQEKGIVDLQKTRNILLSQLREIRDAVPQKNKEISEMKGRLQEIDLELGKGNLIISPPLPNSMITNLNRNSVFVHHQ